MKLLITSKSLTRSGLALKAAFPLETCTILLAYPSYPMGSIPKNRPARGLIHRLGSDGDLRSRPILYRIGNTIPNRRNRKHSSAGARDRRLTIRV